MGMHMRAHFRKTLPDTDDMGDRMTKAAQNAAAQLEGWAKDGYGSMKASPALWGAASLGIGALAGGLYALWRNKDRINISGIYHIDALWNRNGKMNGRAMAARSRTKARRAKLKMDGAAIEVSSGQPAKRAKRRRARPSAQAEA